MFKSVEHLIKSNEVDVLGSFQRIWRVWRYNMHVKAFTLMPTTKRPPAAAVAGTLTLFLMVATIVVAVLEMLPR